MLRESAVSGNCSSLSPSFASLGPIFWGFPALTQGILPFCLDTVTLHIHMVKSSMHFKSACLCLLWLFSPPQHSRQHSTCWKCIPLPKAGGWHCRVVKMLGFALGGCWLESSNCQLSTPFLNFRMVDLVSSPSAKMKNWWMCELQLKIPLRWSVSSGKIK